MQVIIREDYREFAARHAKGGEPIRYGRWILFPDGAMVMAENADARNEPSDDARQRLTAIADYHKAWIDRLCKERFRAATLQGMQEFGPSPKTELDKQITRHKIRLIITKAQFPPDPQVEMQRLLEDVQLRQYAASLGPRMEEQRRQEALRQEQREAQAMLADSGRDSGWGTCH